MKVLTRMVVRNASILTRYLLVGLFLAGTLTFAQTPVVPKKPVPVPAKPKAPAKPAAAKAAVPARKVTPVPVAKTVTPTPVTKATTTAAQSPVQKGTTAGSAATALPVTVSSAASTAPTTAASTLPFTSSTGGSTSANDPRAPVAGQGVGTFLWPGGWTLTAYGCFRTGTRIFCDFDTTNQNNVQVNNTIWSGGGGVNLVDDGGKITRRHNAFFVGTDGSQFDTAYVSPQPVRFIIEYDDVDPRYTSVSLVLGRDRMPGVPISPIDPSQPAGRMPPRIAASSSPAVPAGAATGTGATSAASNGIDKANQTLDTVSQQKKKGQDFWKSVQGAVQPH